MKRIFSIAAIGALGLAMQGAFAVSRAAAQDPILTPIIVSEAAPIIVKTLTPKPKANAPQKFHGYIVHANLAQITVRDKNNEMAVQTFPLSPAVAAQMQKIIEVGGYQYGDKITVIYDPASLTALKLKGKPSRPL